MVPGEPQRVRGRFRILGFIILGVVLVLALQYLLIPYLEGIYPSLANYDQYIRDGVVAVVIFSLAFAVNRVIRSAIEFSSQRRNGRNLRGLYTIFRAVVYGVAIALLLAYMGVSLTGALIGGTVGGLILSFALQNTVSNLLSGLLLASAGVVKPKDKISFFSWLFDNPVIGEILDVKLLTVQVQTIDGNVTELPNTALLGQAQFTNLGVGNIIRASVMVTMPVDAQIRGLMKIATNRLNSMKKDLDVISIESYFFGKAFNSNSVKVIFNFTRVLGYNRIVNAINTSFEEAYWEMKNRAPQGNNITLGFPVDVPVRNIISSGNSILDSRKEAAGILDYRAFFFLKSSTMNTIKVTFSLSDTSVYDEVADTINSSYEDAYLQLKSGSGA